MRILWIVFLLVYSLSSSAKEGIVVQFSIDSEKPVEKTAVTSSYISSVLLEMNGFASLDFDRRYNMRVYSKSSDGKNANLVVGLNEFVGDKLYYVGDKSIDLAIGESKKFDIVGHNNKVLYKIIVSTSYGVLPEVAARTP